MNANPSNPGEGTSEEPKPAPAQAPAEGDRDALPDDVKPSESDKSAQ